MRYCQSIIALYAKRGLPVNPSSEVLKKMQEIAAHETKFGRGEFGGYTHAKWAEIRDFDLTVPPQRNQWQLPFDLARILER